MDATEIVTTYGAAWNEPDEQARRELLTRAWADDGQYSDPTGRADGRDALIAHIGGFQAMMPGHTIDMTSGLDTRDNVFRFAWVMRNGSAEFAREFARGIAYEAETSFERAFGARAAETRDGQFVRGLISYMLDRTS